MSGRAMILANPALNPLTIGCGVFDGAAMPYHGVMSYPGYPGSAIVGTLGNVLLRCALVTAIAATLPVLSIGSAPATLGKPIGTSALATAVMMGDAPLYGTCSKLIPARALGSSPAR